MSIFEEYGAFKRNGYKGNNSDIQNICFQCYIHRRSAHITHMFTKHA